MSPPAQADAGPYRPHGLLGRGAMADVWEAVDSRDGTVVALKVLRGDDPALVARLEREATALARLDHPGLVRLIDAGSADGHPFVAMELVRGTTLADRGAGPMAAAQVAALGAQVASALAYVHAAGIVHRDVKPSNILIDTGGAPHLADFGIAQLSDASGMTATGTTVGTVAYMAPEQLESHLVGPEADVWALGVVLLECLTGRRTYAGTPAEVVARRMAGPVPLPDDLPPLWRTALTGMLQLRPEQRLVASEVADLLAAAAFSGDPRLAGGDPRLAGGDPRLAAGDPRLAAGGSRLAAGGSRLAAGPAGVPGAASTATVRSAAAVGPGPVAPAAVGGQRAEAGPAAGDGVTTLPLPISPTTRSAGSPAAATATVVLPRPGPGPDRDAPGRRTRPTRLLVAAALASLILLAAVVALSRQGSTPARATAPTTSPGRTTAGPTPTTGAAPAVTAGTAPLTGPAGALEALDADLAQGVTAGSLDQADASSIQAGAQSATAAAGGGPSGPAATLLEQAATQAAQREQRGGITAGGAATVDADLARLAAALGLTPSAAAPPSAPPTAPTQPGPGSGGGHGKGDGKKGSQGGGD